MHNCQVDHRQRLLEVVPDMCPKAYRMQRCVGVYIPAHKSYLLRLCLAGSVSEWTNFKFLASVQVLLTLGRAEWNVYNHFVEILGPIPDVTWVKAAGLRSPLALLCMCVRFCVRNDIPS